MLAKRPYLYPPAPAPGLLTSTMRMSSILGLFGVERRRPTHEITVEIDRETDGRFIAEISEMPGVMAYGATEVEALQKVTALAFRVMADRLESEEVQAKPDMRFHLHARECMAGR